MVRLGKETIETWLADRDSFCLAYMEYTFSWHHPVGADLELLRSEIEESHAEWVATVTEWRTMRFRQETESLSYTKIFAILLCALCKRKYIGEMKPYEPFRRAMPEFQGTDEQRQAILEDLLGAPEAVSALQFCLAVLNHYEQKRLDRKTPFVFRMTEQGRHDLLVLLTGDEPSPIAVYLCLESLYPYFLETRNLTLQNLGNLLCS